ncbi:MAG TPA: divergent polysaccharide deacetylase family protein [Dongiaceae bacterium]|nr:divergent polysaccharide deacetylase family protein [Dongiaceae bacterium]
MINTSHSRDGEQVLLSETARRSSSPRRLFGMFLLAAGLAGGVVVVTGTPLLQKAANFLTELGLAAAGQQAAAAAPQRAAPSLTGPVTLRSLSPSELMAQYPAAAGQSLAEGAFDLPLWRRFQRPAGLIAGPRCAILVTGLGLNRALTAAAILYLPPDISLSFSPYAPELGAWIEAARAHGHEALVDLPLESAAPQDDPGPDALMTGLRPEENVARLDRILERAPQALGVTTQLGSRFLTDRGALPPVLAALHKRGAAIIEASQDPRLLTAELAPPAHLPHLKALLASDEAAGRDALLRRLDMLAAAARDKQNPLLVVQPSPLSLALLASWSEQLANQGLALTPASNMLAQ